MRIKFIYFILVLVIVSCSTTKDTVNAEAMVALEAVVAAKNFEFTADSTTPMTDQSMNAIANMGLLPIGSNVGNILLTGTTNFMKVVGDSVAADLPYFGERRFGGGYGAPSGVKFEGIPRDFKVTKKADRILLSFNIPQKSDSFDVDMILFTNHRGVVYVNSNELNFISYHGTFNEIEPLAEN